MLISDVEYVLQMRQMRTKVGEIRHAKVKTPQLGTQACNVQLSRIQTEQRTDPKWENARARGGKCVYRSTRGYGQT